MNTPQINEPTLTGCLTQITEYMELAEMRVSILRGHLFGEGESGPVSGPPTTIDGILRTLSTRLASLCGSLATVNSRIGCAPEPCAPEEMPISEWHRGAQNRAIDMPPSSVGPQR